MERKKKYSSISIYMMLVGLLLIQIGNPLRESSYVSLGTTLIALAAASAFFVAIITEKMDNSFLQILILAIVSLFSMLVASKLNISGIITLICFFEIPLFFYAYKEIDSKKIKRVIYLVYFALSIIYISFRFGENAFVLNKGGREYISESLTLGYNNPNETAIYLFACFAVLVSMVFDVKNKFFRGMLFVVMLHIAYMIWQTESRTMMVVLIALVVAVLFFRNKRMPPLLVFVSFLIPFLFVFILQAYGDSTLFGERLETGRLQIFARVTENLTVIKFLIGDYNFKFDNLHNLYVSIFGTIGIIGVVVYALLLMQKTEYALKKASSRMNRTAAIGFLMLIISASTEAAVFTAGSAFAVSATTLYIMSILKEEDGNEGLTN